MNPFLDHLAKTRNQLIAAKDRTRWLESILSDKSLSISDILKLHDTLLFFQAFPPKGISPETLRACFIQTEDLISHKPSLQKKLSESGLPFTSSTGIFSFDLVQWMNQEFGQEIKIESILAEEEKIIEILRIIAGPLHTEILLEGHETWKTWIKRAFPELTVLEALISLFKHSGHPQKEKNLRWNDLGINIRFETGNAIPSLWEQVFKPVSKAKPSRFPIEIKLDEVENKQLLSVARLTLAFYQRETEPITHCGENGVKYYDLGGNTALAVFYLQPQFRQTIDMYAGYMTFQNGRPFSYGGGWILLQNCRIGVSVFPSCRGGMSREIFTKTLGAYGKIFDVNRFTVDPYQLGKNNEDGIRSGAFWLYYKLGFRPVLPELKALAAAEAGKILGNKTYRSPAQVLRKLASHKMELAQEKRNSGIHLDATDLSVLTGLYISQAFKGNLSLGEEFCRTLLSGLVPKEFWAAGNPVFELRFLISSSSLNKKALVREWIKAAVFKLGKEEIKANEFLKKSKLLSAFFRELTSRFNHQDIG